MNTNDDMLQESIIFPNIDQENLPESIGDDDTFPDEDDMEDNMTDVEADADALASAGQGTDEDYRCFEECHDGE